MGKGRELNPHMVDSQSTVGDSVEAVDLAVNSVVPIDADLAIHNSLIAAWKDQRQSLLLCLFVSVLMLHWIYPALLFYTGIYNLSTSKKGEEMETQQKM